MVSDRCKKYIKNAVEAEEVKVVADNVKYSSSVVDAAKFLQGMFKVRDDLEWPVIVEMMEFTLMIMKEVIDNALSYVIDMFEKLNEDYLFDKEGQFKASPEVSESHNNSSSEFFDYMHNYYIISIIGVSLSEPHSSE